MPEQLTKHPEVTLKVLRSAGAKCAEGAKQEILHPVSRRALLPAAGGRNLCLWPVRCVKNDSDHCRRMEDPRAIASCRTEQFIGFRRCRGSAQCRQRSASRRRDCSACNALLA